MGLLNGDIAQLFGDVFGGIYLPATLIKRAVVKGTGGKLTTIDAPYPCRIQADNCTQAMRDASDYTDSDIRLLILTAGLPVTVDTDCIVSGVRGRDWSIAGPINQDPAGSYFECRGVLKKVQNVG